MNIIHRWAARWGVSPAALDALRKDLCLLSNASPDMPGTERETLARVRLEASAKGILLWRNNSGVLKDEHGTPVRYGLANDSKRVNARLKSSDLIGLRPDGQFVAREIKRPGWKYSGTAKEIAQLNFITLVQLNGGDACFTDCEGSL